MEKKLDEQVFLQITDQVGQLIEDYEKELNKGFNAFPGKFKISFGVVLSSQPEAGKIKVATTMTFATEPKIEQAAPIKDKMEVIVGGQQIDLPIGKKPAEDK